MEPFNIKIRFKKEVVTLTVLPHNQYYKIIFYGAIVGAIQKIANKWEAVPADEIEPGDLPLYEHKQGNNGEENNFELTLPIIREIGAEIELVAH